MYKQSIFASLYLVIILLALIYARMAHWESRYDENQRLIEIAVRRQQEEMERVRKIRNVNFQKDLAKNFRS